MKSLRQTRPSGSGSSVFRKLRAPTPPNPNPRQNAPRNAIETDEVEISCPAPGNSNNNRLAPALWQHSECWAPNDKSTLPIHSNELVYGHRPVSSNDHVLNRFCHNLLMMKSSHANLRARSNLPFVLYLLQIMRLAFAMVAPITAERPITPYPKDCNSWAFFKPWRYSLQHPMPVVTPPQPSNKTSSNGASGFTFAQWNFGQYGCIPKRGSSSPYSGRSAFQSL